MRRSICGLLTVSLLLSVFSITDSYGQGHKTAKPGEPFEVQITPYKTTMKADGKDTATIAVKIIDNEGNTVTTADNLVTFNVMGKSGRIISISKTGQPSVNGPVDGKWQTYVYRGECRVIVQTTNQRGALKFEAKSDSLWTGSTDIQAVWPGVPHPVTNADYKPRKVKGRVLGADISFLPELEAKGMRFSDNGVQKDAIQILKDHGFNYIRLRIFNDPAEPKGYSPGKGFCDLEHTKAMAKRIKAAGMKFLLDFHYSDTWADPGKQFKPAAWVGEDFPALKKSIYDFTKDVMQQLKDQGTTPDMVQVGNEINHGMLWPDGGINNLDTLAQFLYAGITAVKAVSPRTAIMLHIALGGQNSESRFWLDNMEERKVPFDVIGLSYYPKWHGTLTDLKNNMDDLAKRYPQQVMVAEYTQLKREVNDIAFTVPNDKALGTFIWEPLNTWEQFIDKDGKTNDLINIYPEVAKKYDIK
ncbi:MAG TPA: glycosyl hydrolase 53 family protein [Mucilaginibacter sp.]|nr:glycosyl hydrolase 53 family protein [Mucilaginibacter sp.]